MTDTPGEKRHIGWEYFESLVDEGIPAVEVVKGEPVVQLFTDPAGSRIGVRIAGDWESVPAIPLASIRVRRWDFSPGPGVEISTFNRSLYPDFFAFAMQIADRVQIRHMEVGVAVSDALAAWQELLGRLSILNPDRQVGLLGELWFLEELASRRDWAFATEAWRQDANEEHDFGLPGIDVEVKSTRNESRTHVIGSLTQLKPTENRPLFVLSVQFTHAGAGNGYSLAERSDTVQQHIHNEAPGLVTAFTTRLGLAGWEAAHQNFYTTRFRLRSAPALIAVNASFPVITPALLAPLGVGVSERIVGVEYRVRLDGLGVEAGSVEYADALVATGGV